MKGKLGDKARLYHILDAINEIETYLVNTDFETFLNNSMMRFACIKQLEIIGEASNLTSADTKNKFSEIEWQKLVGMRNVLVHEYFGIDVKIVWEIIKGDILPLKIRITEILEQVS